MRMVSVQSLFWWLCGGCTLCVQSFVLWITDLLPLYLIGGCRAFTVLLIPLWRPAARRARNLATPLALLTLLSVTSSDRSSDHLRRADMVMGRSKKVLGTRSWIVWICPEAP